MRGGEPTIRGTRIAVSDVMGWLGAGATFEEILAEWTWLSHEDLEAAAAFGVRDVAAKAQAVLDALVPVCEHVPFDTLWAFAWALNDPRAERTRNRQASPGS